MILVLLGPPGSGKGTQATRLAATCDMIHLSTGELLRQARSWGSPIGREAARYLDAGRLVPDDTVTDLVAERLTPGPETFLMDGFPRNLPQANLLDRLAALTGHTLGGVLFLDVPEPELIRRLAGRARADDDPEIIRRRLAVYAQETEPLVGHYAAKGVLRHVDGQGSISAVHDRIMDALAELCVG